VQSVAEQFWGRKSKMSRDHAMVTQEIMTSLLYHLLHLRRKKQYEFQTETLTCCSLWFV